MSILNRPAGSPAQTSAVAFDVATRPHIALSVSDIDAALPFYSALLGVAPTKVRPGYAKFEPAVPALNLTLNLDPGNAGQRGAAHFGVQVQDTDAVEALAAKVMAAGFNAEVEEGTVCCFSRQDKVWLSDPDGHRWEVFVVIEAHSEVHSTPSTRRAIAADGGAAMATTAGPAPCCTPAVAANSSCCG